VVSGGPKLSGAINTNNLKKRKMNYESVRSNEGDELTPGGGKAEACSNRYLRWTLESNNVVLKNELGQAERNSAKRTQQQSGKPKSIHLHRKRIG